MHRRHVRNGAATFSIVVDVTDASVKISRRHRPECLFINQFDGAVPVRHGDVLEQTLGHCRVTLLRGGRWGAVRNCELRNGNRCRQAAVKYRRLVWPVLQLRHNGVTHVNISIYQKSTFGFLTIKGKTKLLGSYGPDTFRDDQLTG